LYKAAIDQVAEESSKYVFSEAADRRQMSRQLYTAAGLLTLIILAALVLPQATWNSFRRWLAPLARIPRFTLVELAELPAEQIVPHGEKFPVAGKVNYRSFWKPARVKIQFAGGRQIVAQANNGIFSLAVPPLTADERVVLRVGDASHQINL